MRQGRDGQTHQQEHCCQYGKNSFTHSLLLLLLSAFLQKQNDQQKEHGNRDHRGYDDRFNQHGICGYMYGSGCLRILDAMTPNQKAVAVDTISRSPVMTCTLPSKTAFTIPVRSAQPSPVSSRNRMSPGAGVYSEAMRNLLPEEDRRAGQVPAAGTMLWGIWA